jgi:hypothetical protein
MTASNGEIDKIAFLSLAQKESSCFCLIPFVDITAVEY